MNDTAVAGWRESKWLALAEFVLVALAMIYRHWLPVSITPYLLLLAWISLRIRKVSWRSVGLCLYRNWTISLSLGIAFGLALEAFELFISQPLLIRLLAKKPDLDAFSALRGNLGTTLLYIGFAWTLAAFGEEMVYRGYLMNRVAGLFHNTRRAWVLSLIIVHVAFGLAHIYQGVTGVLDEGLMGLFLGLLYLRAGRNLAVPIIAHGVSDTIDFLLMFLGKYPV